MPHDFIEKINRHVDEEDGMFRGVKFFGGLFIGLISFILSLVIWIVLEKNADIKAMQGTLQAHSVQIERTLVMLENVVNSDKRQQERIDKNTERLWNGRK